MQYFHDKRPRTEYSLHWGTGRAFRGHGGAFGIGGLRGRLWRCWGQPGLGSFRRGCWAGAEEQAPGAEQALEEVRCLHFSGGVNANRIQGDLCQVKTGPLVVVLVCQRLRFGPALEPLAVPGQVEDFRVMNNLVDHGRSHGSVAEDIRPPAEGEVARENQRSVLVSRGDQLEEQIRRGLIEGDVSDFIDDDQLVAA